MEKDAEIGDVPFGNSSNGHRQTAPVTLKLRRKAAASEAHNQPLLSESDVKERLVAVRQGACNKYIDYIKGLWRADSQLSAHSTLVRYIKAA